MTLRLCALGSRRQHQGAALPAVLAGLGCALVLAACGTSGTPGSTSATSSQAGSPSSFARSQLAAVRCIRAHGVPNMPDPTFGAGGAQVNLAMPPNLASSPAFARAQAQCAKQGVELAGYASSQAKPAAAEMAQWLAVARCMRTHGLPDFPDPATAMPPDPATYPARYSAAFSINGVDWAIPKSIDLQSPAVKKAASACGPNALSLIGP